MVTFLCIGLWIVAGIVLGAPYRYLSDGVFDIQHVPVAMVLLLPAGVLGLVRVHERMKKGLGSRKFFWGFLAWMCLPFIMNGASHLLQRAGHPLIAAQVFALRYDGLWITAVALGCFFMGRAILMYSGSEKSWSRSHLQR